MSPAKPTICSCGMPYTCSSSALAMVFKLVEQAQRHWRGDGEFRPHVQPVTLQVDECAAPIVCTFPCAIDKTDQLLLALRRRPDQHEDALLLVLETRFEMDSIRPDVNVAFA